MWPGPTLTGGAWLAAEIPLWTGITRSTSIKVEMNPPCSPAAHAVLIGPAVTVGPPWC